MFHHGPAFFIKRLLWVGSLWAAAVILAAQTGALAAIYPPLIAALVATGILVPTLWYALSPGLRDMMDTIGHRPILLLHTWRIPAALVFFWYGYFDQLPAIFWLLAGTGDLLAGALAAWTALGPQTAARIKRFHLFGFADFVVAVGTGLTFTLLLDPRMSAIATLPLALIPLFGVGISGATHLIAFDMLRREVGLDDAPSQDHRRILPQ